jgi:hypothetical protein
MVLQSPAPQSQNDFWLAAFLIFATVLCACVAAVAITGNLVLGVVVCVLMLFLLELMLATHLRRRTAKELLEALLKGGSLVFRALRQKK